MSEIERNEDERHLLIAEIVGGVVVTMPTITTIAIALVSLISK